MSEATARPQDLGRPHRRARPGPSPETARILEAYRSAMRGELEALLAELTARSAQETLDGSPAPLVLGITARRERWDLAIKIGRELGAPGLAELEEEPPATVPSGPSAAPRRAPRLSARDRRSLGG